MAVNVRGSGNQLGFRFVRIPMMDEVTKAAVVVLVFFRFLPLEAEITMFTWPASDNLEFGGHRVERFDTVIFSVEEDVDVKNMCVVERFALIRSKFEFLDDDLAGIIDARRLEAARVTVGGAERDRNGTQF